MQLWNDYEGKTIADTYSLGRLLRPEGRSALFALPKGTDAPGIIRLTEAINDEGQMIACWTRVSELHQENLLAIKRFGETTFEGTPLTYAVMEPTDANLADLLKERPLTHAEALQVANSLTAALTAIHAQGLVHGHIDATNVLAVGETVKLRTDCVSQCLPEPGITTEEDCANLRQRDVAALASLLLHAITLDRKLDPTTKLQAPFDRIVPNALNGFWSLTEISSALNPPAPAVPPPTIAEPTPQLELPLNQTQPASETPIADDPIHFRRNHSTTPHEEPRLPIWVGVVVLAIVVLVLGLHAISRKPSATPEAAAPQPVPTAPAQTAPSTPPSASANQPAAAHMAPGWYVVAYTFNRQAEAVSRADAIARKHPGLHPEVISPSGRSPYLVALRGPMSRPEAEATRNQARQSGLPRDTFVRNYKGA